MEEIRLFVDDDLLYPSSAEIMFCRICHEAEFESSKTLEAPCSCSGTVKFAHRDCIQRWCDEKGNTICEICLQKFEPGYTSSPTQKQLIHHVSLQVPEIEINPAIIAEEENLFETEYASAKSASICRISGLIFTLLLLLRHFLALIGGTGDYPFTLFTLLVLRASGILIPMYIIMCAVDAIHNSITRHYQVSENDNERQQHRVNVN